MTDDLVKRLRDFEQWMRDPEDQKFTLSSDLFDEAASRIEQLKFILACALADYKSSRCPDEMFFDWIDDARAALGEKKDA